MDLPQKMDERIRLRAVQFPPKTHSGSGRVVVETPLKHAFANPLQMRVVAEHLLHAVEHAAIQLEIAKFMIYALDPLDPLLKPLVAGQ